MGDMRERVTFQTPTESVTAGQPTLTWANIATTPTMWAKITTLPGSSHMEAERFGHDMAYHVSIRRRTDLTTNLRLSWAGVYLRIKSISQDSVGRVFTRLLCHEYVD